VSVQQRDETQVAQALQEVLALRGVVSESTYQRVCEIADAALTREQALRRELVQLERWVWDAERQDEKRLVRECARLRMWVRDLHSGMWLNCAFCGHRYGPGDALEASTMIDALRAHIAQCPEHPMTAMRARIAELESAARAPRCEAPLLQDLGDLRRALRTLKPPPGTTVTELLSWADAEIERAAGVQHD
jgi:hypothetical protein